MAAAAVLGAQCASCCVVSRIELSASTLHPDGLACSEQVGFVSLSRGIRSSSANVLRKAAGSNITVMCAVKPLLDHRDMETVQSQEQYWTEQLFSALQRSLLETQWALSSSSSAGQETTGTPTTSQKQFEVVRSGRPSARQRRLNDRLQREAVATNKVRTVFSTRASISSPKISETGESGRQRKRKQAKVKPEPVQDFISSFLRPTAKCEFLTKDEEAVFSRQMRIRQSLEKAKIRLWKDLGHEPSYELWAQSVHVSTGELISKVAEGEKARNKMMVAHLRLVVSVARHYQHLGVDMADLIQEGSRGLLRGLERFDHTKGYKLSTYVHWWIRQGVTRAIAEHSRMMRVPVYMHETLYAIKKAKLQLISEGKPITVKNLSEVLKISSRRVQSALKVKNKIVPLDKVMGANGLKEEFNNTLHEIVPDQNLDNQPWALLDGENLKGTLRKRLSSLSIKEQMVIQWHYGLDSEGGSCSTLASVGERLGLSKERVRQIECSAMQKIRLEIQDSRTVRGTK